MKETAQIRWTEQARFYSIAAMLLVATAQAIAQSKPGAAAASGAAGRRIIISVPDRKLALIDGGRVVGVYPVAVGAKVSPSPSGEFQIISRITNPTYYHPGVVIPAGKDNPLGTRWMGLNRKGYGIHGTNQPRSIGHAASHGCIRLAKADLEELFAQVRLGDVVEIHTELDPETAAIFEPGRASRQTAAADSAVEASSASSGQM